MAISLVQSKTASGTTTTGGSISFTSTGTGNLLVVCFCAGNANGTTNPTFTTPSGWTAEGAANTNNVYTPQAGQLFYYPNNPGGLTSVTLTCSAMSSGCGWSAIFLEFSGIATASPLDAEVQQAPGTYAATLSETLTTTANGDLVIGFAYTNTSQAGGTINGEPSGWTTITGVPVNDVSGDGSLGAAWQVQASSGAITYNPTSSVSQQYIEWVVSFKAASGGGGTAWNQTVGIDTQSARDSATESLTKRLTEAESALDLVTKQAEKSLADAQSGADGSTRQGQKNLSEGQSGTDGLTKSYQKLLTDALSATDVIVKALTRAFKEWVSETDTASTSLFSGNSWRQTLTDSHSAQDSIIQKMVQLVRQEAHSATDAALKQVLHTLADVWSATDAQQKTLSKPVFDALSETDKVTVARGVVQAVFDAFSEIDVAPTAFVTHPVGAAVLGVATAVLASLIGATLVIANGVGIAVPLLALLPPTIGATLTLKE